MSSKQSHEQLKSWLDDHAKIDKYLNQCVVCQDKGYDPEKIEQRKEALFRSNIKKYFDSLVLDELGRCKVCASSVSRHKEN